MAQGSYKVTLTGKTLPGFEVEEAQRAFASAFKIPIANVGKYFQGKPVVIKSNIDLATAEKYCAAIEKTGAECRVIAVEEADPLTKQPEPEQPLKTEKSSEIKSTEPSPAGKTKGVNSGGMVPPRRIQIDLPPKPASLQFAPLECPAITATGEGLNFNRFSCEDVPYSEILSVIAYNLPSGAKLKTRLMIFIVKQKKPLLIDAAMIRYDEFPGTRGEGNEESLRNFVAYLLKKCSVLRMDKATSDFLDGEKPVTFKKNEAMLASSAGFLLDSENLFILQALKGTLASKAAAASVGEEPSSGKSPEKTVVPALTDDELLRLFIGPHADVYRERLRNFRDGNFGISWHWPAFLAPIFWHFYRKIFLAGLGMIGLTVLILMTAFIHPAFLLLMLFVHVISGATAEYIYGKLVYSSIRLIADNQLIEDKAATVKKEGGVNPTAVYITSAAFAVILLIASVVFIFNFVMNKTHDLIAKAAETPPMPQLPPGVKLPPGMTMPQSPQQAMEMAYDTAAQAELRSACTAAQVFFAQEGGGGSGEPLTLDVLKNYGFNPPPEIQIRLIDASPQNLRMGARHMNGSKEVLVDKDCRFINTP